MSSKKNGLGERPLIKSSSEREELMMIQVDI
jgi:hypothetical protein